MQELLGGPRAGLTQAEVVEVLSHEAGGRIRWGVVIEDSNGDARGPMVLSETTDEDWNAGTLDPGLVVQNGSVTGTTIVTVNSGNNLTVNSGLLVEV